MPPSTCSRMPNEKPYGATKPIPRRLVLVRRIASIRALNPISSMRVQTIGPASHKLPNPAIQGRCGSRSRSARTGFAQSAANRRTPTKRTECSGNWPARVCRRGAIGVLASRVFLSPGLDLADSSASSCCASRFVLGTTTLCVTRPEPKPNLDRRAHSSCSPTRPWFLVSPTEPKPNVTRTKTELGWNRT